MLHSLDAWLQTLGPWGLGAVFLACAVEYVFPPFPGDALTLLGGVYAVRGHLAWPLVFAVATAGSVAGGAAAFAIGRWGGRLAERLPGRRGFTWLTATKLHAWETQFRTRGVWLLLLNRFMPAVRGPLFFAAGACGVPPRRALVFGGISAAVWNALILGAGWAVGGNVERLADLADTYGRAAGAVIAVAVVALVARAAWRRYR